jgi:hypothetical protein
MVMQFVGGCKLQAKNSVYLMQNGIYTAPPTNCITILLNASLQEGGETAPNWVNVQVTRYYETYDNIAVTLARRGTFKRDGKPLPNLPESGVPVPQLSLEGFDAAHAPTAGDRSVEDTDRLLGLPWHGSPEGNDAATTWSARDQLKVSKSFDAQIKLTARSLHTRLIRFTPGDRSGAQTIGQINRNGANLMVVKVFSPSSTDIGGTFALVFESDPQRLAELISGSIPASTCSFLCQLARWF